MGDDVDGSSSAAHGAQDQEEGPRGFFGRIIGALSADSEKQGTDNGPGLNGHARPQQALGMLNLRRLRLDDVSIPKVEIAAVPVDIGKDELIAVFRNSGFSRLPVFDGTLDTPLGMVHLKDLALVHGFNGGGPEFDLRAMVRPLLFAPPSMPIGVMLQKMQSDRIHMALVIDEYGGVDGLVTLEDLIEPVVGEIADEHDVEETQPWVRENTGCYVVQARAPLEDFENEIGIALHDPEADDEIDTMGGLVFVLTGRVPARGEVVPHPAGPEFEILDADARRVKRLRVRVPDANWS
ncbi:MAG: hemolysin family protein [Pseudomonadota bacterium]